MNRAFQVHVNGAKSSARRIVAGLAQGSILSPTLFNLFISDLRMSPKIIVAMYADDTALLAASNRGNTIIRRLQSACNDIAKYMSDWKIKINSAKTQLLFFPLDRRRRRLPTHQLYMGGRVVERADHATYLGVLLDSKLTFAKHFNNVKIKTMRSIRALYPMLASKSRLSISNKLLIYTGIIRPIMLYAAPVWKEAAPKLKKCLQVLQNKCLRTILGKPPRYPTTTLHQRANIPLINDFINLINDDFVNSCANSDFDLIRELNN